jgi:8-oxo-dGTP pyrophosphatase MutT (NUDIX family)
MSDSGPAAEPAGCGDGDGWAICELGHRHWGRFGAAGLLLHALAHDTVLLQHRAPWSHEGDTWGLPGGARHSHESAPQAALREAREETALDSSAVRLRGEFVDDHGGWSYTTVLATCPDQLPVRRQAESVALRWVPVAQVSALPLHPGFAAWWPELAARLTG